MSKNVLSFGAAVLTTHVASCILPNLGRMKGLERKENITVLWLKRAGYKVKYTLSVSIGRSGLRAAGRRGCCWTSRPWDGPGCEPSSAVLNLQK